MLNIICCHVGVNECRNAFWIAHGGNATISHLGAIVASSADTTFYIAAIYFGAVMIRNARHALSLSIIVDIIGMLSAIWIGGWLLR